MLTEITLENFKCFQEATTFPLSKINLLTGINGRGKSTLLQSLLLMKQSIEYTEYLENYSLTLNGVYLRLGERKNVKNINKKENDSIRFLFNFKDGNNQHITSVITKDTNFLIVTSTSEFDISKTPDYLKEVFFKKNKSMALEPLRKIHYISADRLGSQEYYKKFNPPNFISVDKKGENVASILDLRSYKLVYEPLQIENEAKDLKTQVGCWLSRIFDNDVEVNIDNNSSPYIIPLTFIIDGEEFTPPNVGFGYSHVLPIIVAGLIAEEGEILIIENPEAHLHPKAQSELTKFLAKVASCGVQVFIETHSDHILNGLRIAVKHKILAPEDTKVLYFSKDKETNENKIYYPQIDSNGRVNPWKEGFFDEWDNSLLELA